MVWQVQEGLHRNTIIHHHKTGVSSPANIIKGLAFLRRQAGSRLQTVILAGDLGCNLPHSREDQVSKALQKGKVNLLFVDPKEHERDLREISEKVVHHESIETLFLLPEFLKLQDSVILLYGSKTEQVRSRIAPVLHESIFHVSLDALHHNLTFYRNRIGPSAKIMVMVKANAYGCGLVEVGHSMEWLNASYLGVAFAHEGVQLRDSGVTMPILVLNTAISSFPVIIEKNLEIEIYSFRMLDAWCDYIREVGRKVPAVHLKIDTGMYRLGFSLDDIPELVERLKREPLLQFSDSDKDQSPSFRVAAVFSHLVGADEAIHNEFTQKQYSRFTFAADAIESALVSSGQPRPMRHLLNSAGSARFPEMAQDMVRIGIGFYGFETANVSDPGSIVQVGQLKSVLSRIFQVKAEETVGYSRKGVMPKTGLTGTVPTGYADGIDRRLSNGNSTMVVQGVECPIIGNVCMDMTMINLNPLTEKGLVPKEGDEVIIFGAHNSMAEISEKIGTIPYTMMTALSARLGRVYTLENEKLLGLGD
eukprot:TRINITY_DN5483_c0_g1_i1.p1 TRINITY_DN5483_c0_g1~~TRINITY_DN5483_c0_g1_i1.p1  ORF type:complete len:533 (-),score=56.19 TRINITY_DN5483_c0_g1_i1:78-1676(-)